MQLSDIKGPGSMFDIPDWLQNLILVALGSLGTLGLGLLRAKSERDRMVTDDRAAFTTQVLERVAQVEAQIKSEREHCRAEITRVHAEYQARLDSRDKIITELRDRVDRLDGRNNDNTPDPRV